MRILTRETREILNTIISEIVVAYKPEISFPSMLYVNLEVVKESKYQLSSEMDIFEGVLWCPLYLVITTIINPQIEPESLSSSAKYS